MRSQLSPEQQSQKVMNRWDLARNKKWSLFLNHLLVPELGSYWCEIKKEAQIWGPFFGSRFGTCRFASFILMVAGCFVFAVSAMVVAKTCPPPASCVCQHRRNACVPAAAAQEGLRGDVAQQQSVCVFTGASSPPTGAVYVAWLHTWRSGGPRSFASVCFDQRQ